MSTSEPIEDAYRSPQPGQMLLTEEVKDSGRTAVSYLFWIACLSGFCGLHRLYNGKIGTGLLWMFTFGLLGVGQLVDLALIPEMSEQRSRRLKERKYRLVQHDNPTLLHTAKAKERPLTIQLLQLAKRNQGRLLVTDCVLQTGASFAEVETQLQDLVKSGYAHVTNDEHSGVVVYEIPELEA